MSTRTIRLLTDDLNSIEGRNESFSPTIVCDYGLAEEAVFARRIVNERRRTERSSRPFLLMLIEAHGSLRPVNGTRDFLHRLTSALKESTRETDTMGWYEEERIIGVIFTEVGDADQSTMTAIVTKITHALRTRLSGEQVARLEISLHRYPDDGQPSQRLEDLVFHPDLSWSNTQDKIGQIIKRTMDVTLSALLLVLLSPVFLAVALAVKLTSKGPVLYRQRRIGQYGIPFMCLKFRSMDVKSDPRIHEEYVAQLISGAKAQHKRHQTAGVFKITQDPRVTPIGAFLRKSSLDELPQLWNVLRGEMSLVGPRPPVPYEFERYDVWHRRRVLEAKPGITGLWQVTGRSRTTFDDMVRLDLKYVNDWSLLLDLKILLQTPGAVLSGNGAY